MYVRIKKAFEFKNEKGEKITAPRGWIGDLPDDHGDAAIKSGHAVPGDPRTLPKVEPVVEKPDDGLDAKTKTDLEALAKERGVDISAAKTKADIVEALRKA